MPIFRQQSIHTLLDMLDKCSQSLLFTLVNNDTSIVNTDFFSRRRLIRRKVVHYSSVVVSLDIHKLKYIAFNMMNETVVNRQKPNFGDIDF